MTAADAIQYATFKLMVANSLFTTTSIWNDRTKAIVAKEALRLAKRVGERDQEYIGSLLTFAENEAAEL